MFSLPLAPLTVVQPLGARVVIQITHRQESHRPFYVVGAGALFGFVATLAKYLIIRAQTIVADRLHPAAADWLTVGCVNCLSLAALVGSHFVQLCCAGGSPDVVVAGLIVIDPIVGVTKGNAVLGEAAQAVRGRLSPVRSPD